VKRRKATRSGLQPLRQQVHLTGRLPLNLLFQQNRPKAAIAIWAESGHSACTHDLLSIDLATLVVATGWLQPSFLTR